MQGHRILNLVAVAVLNLVPEVQYPRTGTKFSTKFTAVCTHSCRRQAEPRAVRSFAFAVHGILKHV